MKSYYEDPITGLKVYTMKQSDILECPFAIMVSEHYRSDGTCLCDDPVHRNTVMIAEWGYIEQEILEALDYRDAVHPS